MSRPPNLPERLGLDRFAWSVQVAPRAIRSPSKPPPANLADESWVHAKALKTPCGSCRSRQTHCVYYRDDSGNAGRAHAFELRCDECGYHTYLVHDD